MWFIFPQFAGLGSSPMSKKFAISSREEAIKYLNHPISWANGYETVPEWSPFFPNLSA